MQKVIFRSRYGSAMFQLKDGTRIWFENGRYETEDPGILAEMRQIVEIERISGNRSVTETIETDDTRVSGRMRLELANLPEGILLFEDATILEVMDRIKAFVELPQAQLGSSQRRLDDKIEEQSIKPEIPKRLTRKSQSIKEPAHV